MFKNLNISWIFGVIYKLINKYNQLSIKNCKPWSFLFSRANASFCSTAFSYRCFIFWSSASAPSINIDQLLAGNL